MSDVVTSEPDPAVLAEAVAALIREGQLRVFVSVAGAPEPTSLADLDVPRERDAFAAIVTELAVLSARQRQRVLDAVQASYGE